MNARYTTNRKTITAVAREAIPNETPAVRKPVLRMEMPTKFASCEIIGDLDAVLFDALIPRTLAKKFKKMVEELAAK